MPATVICSRCEEEKPALGAAPPTAAPTPPPTPEPTPPSGPPCRNPVDNSFPHKPSRAWPLDLNTNSPSDEAAGDSEKHRTTRLRGIVFVAPIYRLNKSPGDEGFHLRWDLSSGNNGLSNQINIVDLAAGFAGTKGYPPMFGGTKAFNGPKCSWPP